MDAPTAGAQAVNRAFAVLGCFRGNDVELGVAAIARTLELSTSTVHRLARTLVEAGFLEQDPTSSRYRLGATFAEYGRLVYHQHRVHLAEPELRRLARQTRESVALAIRRGGDAVLITEANSGPYRDVTGIPLPLHASAMGKVLLAWGDVDLRSLGPLAPRTDRTVTTVEALRAELNRTRSVGYALNDEELEAGIRTIAVPVFAQHDQLVFALAVRGEAADITDDRIPGLVEQATASAVRIGHALTHA